MAGDQKEYDNAAGNKADVIFGNDHIMGDEVGRCQGFFQGARKQVKIDGNDQAAGKNPQGDIKLESDQSDDDGRCK